MSAPAAHCSSELPIWFDGENLPVLTVPAIHVDRVSTVELPRSCGLFQGGRCSLLVMCSKAIAG